MLFNAIYKFILVCIKVLAFSSFISKGLFVLLINSVLFLGLGMMYIATLLLGLAFWFMVLKIVCQCVWILSKGQQQLDKVNEDLIKEGIK